MNDKKKEPEKLTGDQKAAIFLMKMGEEYATEVFKRMTDEEIRKAATAMSAIDQITPEALAEVMEEFVGLFEGESSLIIEGQSFLKNVIGKSLEKDRAESLLKELEDQQRDLPFDWSRRVNISTLASYIEGEHPQTVAMILAHLPSEISSEILMNIPDDKKGDIALRIAHLGQVPEDIVRDVDEALKREFKTLSGTGGGKTGGLQVLVDIINGVDKATEEVIMELIEEEQTEMASEIRAMMFVFEDLVRVDDKAMREILKKVEGAQLTLSLKTASDEMKEKILGNLSSRASEMLMEDLEVMGPVKLSEVEEAQQEIVRAAKELEAEGTIALGGKGKDDILV